MENVDSLLELRHVEDPVLDSGTDPQLVDARPDSGHRLPVFGLEAQLHQVKIVAANPPGILGEGSQIRKGRTDPAQGFHGRAAPYKNQYIDASARRGRRRPSNAVGSVPGGSGSDAKEECRVKYRVLIEQDEDGVFVAEVPSLPGCVTQGSTRSEALANAHEAIAGYLESLKAHDQPIPPPIEEGLIDVAV